MGSSSMPAPMRSSRCSGISDRLASSLDKSSPCAAICSALSGSTPCQPCRTAFRPFPLRRSLRRLRMRSAVIWTATSRASTGSRLPPRQSHRFMPRRCSTGDRSSSKFAVPASARSSTPTSGCCAGLPERPQTASPNSPGSSPMNYSVNSLRAWTAKWTCRPKGDQATPLAHFSPP